METSPLLKYRAVAKYDPETKTKYQVGIVLRENGRFEVYSDFMLVREYQNSQLQCVDVETDFNQFFFKFVKNSDQVSPATHSVNADGPGLPLRYDIRQVLHSWRNRISINTAEKLKYHDMWDYVIHNRISDYFRMYTQHLNFSNFLLVSHRNMISVYRKTTSPQDDGWVDTIKFSEGFVRNMFMKKRSKIEMDTELSLSKKVSRMTDHKTGD